MEVDGWSHRGVTFGDVRHLRLWERIGAKEEIKETLNWLDRYLGPVR